MVPEPMADDEASTHSNDDEDINIDKMNMASDPEEDLNEIIFPEGMTTKEKQRRISECNSKIPDQFRVSEWEIKFRDSDYSISTQIAHQQYSLQKIKS